MKPERITNEIDPLPIIYSLARIMQSVIARLENLEFQVNKIEAGLAGLGATFLGHDVAPTDFATVNRRMEAIKTQMALWHAHNPRIAEQTAAQRVTDEESAVYLNDRAQALERGEEVLPS